MEEKIVAIDETIYKVITGDMSEAGQACVLDESILDYMGKTTGTESGRKLYTYLERMINLSKLHSYHAGIVLPEALNKICDSIIYADRIAANSIITCGTKHNKMTPINISKQYEKIYDYIETKYGFEEDEMTYLKENYSSLLLALYGASLYSSSDADKILERIHGKLRLFHASVYGEVLVGQEMMKKEKINANAEYIYWYLRDKGWSKEAICGLLGNIYEESKVNPGVWQHGVNSLIGGYGIVQYTSDDRKEFFRYMEKQGYTVPNGLNELVRDNPKKAMNCQLDYLMQSKNWYYTDEFKRYFDFTGSDYEEHMPDKVQMSFKEFQNSNAAPSCLALIFHASYERSMDTIDAIDERGASAEEWYEYFKDYE